MNTQYMLGKLASLSLFVHFDPHILNHDKRQDIYSFDMHPAMLSIALPSSSPTGLVAHLDIVRGKSFSRSEATKQSTDCRVSLRSTRNDMLEIAPSTSQLLTSCLQKVILRSEADEAVYRLPRFTPE